MVVCVVGTWFYLRVSPQLCRKDSISQKILSICTLKKLQPADCALSPKLNPFVTNLLEVWLCVVLAMVSSVSLWSLEPRVARLLCQENFVVREPRVARLLCQENFV